MPTCWPSLRANRGVCGHPSGETHGFALSTHIAPRLLFELHGGDYRCGRSRIAHATTDLLPTGTWRWAIHTKILSLAKRVVQIELCGATAKVHGWGNADLLPGVKVNTDAMARTTRLVQEGFVKISE
jgi:hypothetical protein